MAEKVYYIIDLDHYDVEKAAQKLIRKHTSYHPEYDHERLSMTYFYGIKLEEVFMDCIEGNLEWRYYFSDDGTLKKWKKENT